MTNDMLYTEGLQTLTNGVNMLNQHSITPDNNDVLNSNVEHCFNKLTKDTNLDFKLTTKALRYMYGSVKTDAMPFIEKHMLEYGINNKKRMSLFLASCFIMSCGFRRVAEKFTITACRLIKEYPDKISNADVAKRVVRCGDREVANLIYSFQFGNGGIDSDDGWLYRARTPMQFRGRDLYTIVQQRTGLDCIENPDTLNDLENSVIAAMAIWEHLKYNEVADKLQFESAYQLQVKTNNNNTRNYRSNRGALNARKKLDGNTSGLIDFCTFIEMGMLYL